MSNATVYRRWQVAHRKERTAYNREWKRRKCARIKYDGFLAELWKALKEIEEACSGTNEGNLDRMAGI